MRVYSSNIYDQFDCLLPWYQLLCYQQKNTSCYFYCSPLEVDTSFFAVCHLEMKIKSDAFCTSGKETGVAAAQAAAQNIRPLIGMSGCHSSQGMVSVTCAVSPCGHLGSAS